MKRISAGVRSEKIGTLASVWEKSGTPVF